MNDSPPVSYSPTRASEIPQILRAIPRWIRWTQKGKRKVPHGSILDQTIAQRFEQVAEGSTQIGILLTEGVRRTKDGAVLVALDLDAARDPDSGQPYQWAAGIIHHLGSYTEQTPSGTGYRVWVWVRDPPKPLPRLPIPDCDPAVTPPSRDGSQPGHGSGHSSGKRPEVQVFGLGPAQYVTVTGARVGEATGIRTVTGPDLIAVLPPVPPGANGAVGSRLPTGNAGNPTPTLDEIELAIRSAPEGPALLDGRWEELKVPSASEAWWRLVRHVLRAARGDGETAVDFLLERTAFGTGQVDSFDPGKYTKRGWVEADVIRVASRSGEVDPATDRPALQFAPIDPADVEAFEPGSPGEEGLAWIQPAADYLAHGYGQTWLVHPLVPRQGWVQFFGPPASGKTPMGMSLATAVAAGIPQWHGFDIDRRGAGVLYMVGEGESGIRARYTAQRERLMEDHPGCDPTPNFYFSTRPGALVDDKDSRGWIRQVQKVCQSGVALVVIDTQNLNFGPGNENSSEDMTRFVLALKRLSRALDCLVVTIHHSGLMATERARGSSVQFGALDAQFEVSLMGGVVTARPAKVKDAATPETPIRSVLEVRRLGLDEKGRPITAVCLSECPPEEEVKAVFEALDGAATGTDKATLEHFLLAVHAGHSGHRGLFGRARGKITARVESWAVSQDLVRKVSLIGCPSKYELRPEGKKWVVKLERDQVLGEE